MDQPQAGWPTAKTAKSNEPLATFSPGVLESLNCDCFRISFHIFSYLINLSLPDKVHAPSLPSLRGFPSSAHWDSNFLRAKVVLIIKQA